MAGGRRRPTTTPIARLARAVGVVALAALVAWEGSLGRYSAASHASVLAVIVSVVLLALVAGRSRQRASSRTWAGGIVRMLREAAVWSVLIAATVSWDLASFVAQSHSLPTLSRILGAVTDHDWGRALVFAAWLVLGLYLTLGERRGPVARAAGEGPPRERPSTGGP
ncbi:MAG TPA: hypothetical protein VND62_06165 [Acidimicrobiales bacterium]|nr:hypothetical protein [Acidimicrobiales bacterium]